ncbi:MULTISPECIES: hypothetical protein [unclassified Oceanispirochaeta]|uniref:hypothetical protein n=1 Tax=unclassified Oceanispirochaeta TaxID=2635722 RepID=UPI000E093062|nr:MULTISPECIES: hypothetical protein [unclassified Oceanispirochaeta]MBF9014249.1 hypothetical protein [Oceanispirochaeta sp. M2]NPD71135.1 hypothetical protein [Oceanispirochaeta sp. M1]RDG33529.1 hypothetical protein DV872_03390 [Oceanispirochaeta sp. M1]
MKRNITFKIIFLFILYFAFQWSGQYAAGKLAEEGSRLFLLLMYGGFFLRAFVWIEILRDMKLISAYSMSSLSYLIIPLLSRWFMGESYKSTYFMGGVLILAGIIIFSVGEQKQTKLMENL